MQGRHVLAALLLSAGLLVALVWLSGLSVAGLWQAIRAVPAWACLPIALGQAVIIVLGALKWRLVIANTEGASLTLRDAVASTTLGTLAGQVLPIQVVTPLARAWVAGKAGITPGRAIGTSLLEQSFEILVLACMALAALVASTGDLAWPVAVLICGATAALATLLVGPTLDSFARFFSAVAERLRGHLQLVLARLSEGFTAAARLPQRVLLLITGLSFLRYALLASLNVLILAALVPGADKAALFLAFPIVLLVMSLPVFPGGLGVVELT
ncbi:MAG: lysylphosphatidylglycerol synthase transmembrane domain-containing protein, partial [Rhodobacterales bacterium]|nr:lysylphosphatidylglycerol synthase transmembrane domain-containing protein [Rhodobacterales bacterium]